MIFICVSDIVWSPGGGGFSLADKLCNRRNQVLSIVLGCQHDVLFQQSVSHISIRGALYRNSSQTQHPACFISRSVISVFSLLFVFSFTEQVHWTERRYTHSHVLLGKGNSFQILNLQTSKQNFYFIWLNFLLGCMIPSLCCFLPYPPCIDDLYVPNGP